MAFNGTHKTDEFCGCSLMVFHSRMWASNESRNVDLQFCSERPPFGLYVSAVRWTYKSFGFRRTWPRSAHWAHGALLARHRHIGWWCCLWPPCVADADVIFLPCSFFLSSSCLFLSSPNLSRRRLDVYHTSTHGVALVRIWNASLKRAACGSLKIQDAKLTQKSPSAHHRTTLSGYIFATNAWIDNRKKMLNSNISPHVLIIMVNFGPLAAGICWRVWVWGIPAISTAIAFWQRYCTALQ